MEKRVLKKGEKVVTTNNPTYITNYHNICEIGSTGIVDSVSEKEIGVLFPNGSIWYFNHDSLQLQK